MSAVEQREACPSALGARLRRHADAVLVVSNEGWGPRWLSKHHYARELARHVPTYFLNPAHGWRPGARTSIRAERAADGPTCLTYGNALPVLRPEGLFRRWNDRIVQSRLGRFLRERHERWLVWQFDVVRLVGRPAWARRRIFHAVDPFSLWPPEERELVRSSDVVVVVREEFSDRYAAWGARPLCLPHGVAEEQSIADSAAARRLREELGEFALVVGSLNDDLDVELLVRVATRISGGQSLVLVGTVEMMDAERRRRFDRLAAHPRVHLAGEIPTAEVSSWVAASKVGLVPYRLREDLARTPLKALNYLALAKPVVTTTAGPTPTLEGRAVYRSTTEFENRVAEALDGSLEVDEEAVRSYLAEVSYPKLVAQILDRLDAATGSPS